MLNHEIFKASYKMSIYNIEIIVKPKISNNNASMYYHHSYSLNALTISISERKIYMYNT